GARLHLLHLSTRDGIRMVRQAKAEGRPVTAEANPFAMFVTNDWRNIERLGPFALGFWVPEADNPAMWEAIVDGTIDVVGSDHGAHTKKEKEVGWTDMYTAPGGSPFIEHYLRMLLTQVSQGGLTGAALGCARTRSSSTARGPGWPGSGAPRTGSTAPGGPSSRAPAGSD